MTSDTFDRDSWERCWEQQVSVDAAVVALDPREWQIVLAEVRTRGEGGAHTGSHER
jgi:hypothetical protein